MVLNQENIRMMFFQKASANYPTFTSSSAVNIETVLMLACQDKQSITGHVSFDHMTRGNLSEPL